MKRSTINHIYHEALAAFTQHGWVLPPRPRWDITDFGLADFTHYGLTLINLAEEPEYCEKLMYARGGQVTPAHTHRVKKEDIIARQGLLSLRLWNETPATADEAAEFSVRINGEPRTTRNGAALTLAAGERITLTPGIYHEFWAEGGPCVIGEVSTANDDAHDNLFAHPGIGRYPEIEEDEPAVIRLISEA